MPGSSHDLPRPLGPFTLLRLLAQGGMGAVYLALRPLPEDEASRRGSGAGGEEVCVIKLIRADLKADREAVGRFLDEARVVQMLSHPRVVRTLDAGIIDKSYFLALEFISGKNLRDLHAESQRQGKSVPPSVIIHAIADILEALDYAHNLRNADGQSVGIIHRDVSPHNIMLGFDGKVKLIDFGLAMHELKRELTRPGVMVGKLRYNAPEQVRDRAMDGRADLYSCGVILYELFSNERFYEGLAEEQIWRVAMRGDHRPSRFQELPADVRAVLDVALAAEPQRRFPDARQMREALLDLAEGRGIDISRMRKEARTFIGELYPQEEQLERTMMTQATGIAKARTKFGRVPSRNDNMTSLSQAPRGSAKHQPEPTQVVSTADPAYGRVQEMMEHFAAPDALTRLPQAPVRSSEQLEDEDIDDSFPTTADAPAPAPVKRAPQRPVHRTIAELDEASIDRATRAVESARPRGAEDMDAAVAPMPPLPVPTASSMRRSGNAAIKPLPPVAQRNTVPMIQSAQPPVLTPKSNVWWPIISAVLFVALVLTIGLVVLKRPPTRGGIDQEPVTVVPVKQPTQVDVVVPVEPVEKVESVEKVDPETKPDRVDRRPDKRSDPKPDPKPDPKAEPKPDPKPKVEPKADAPPKKSPKTFSDQIDYLRRYCAKRVACAASVVDAMQGLKGMAPNELKDLREQAQKCVDRCQR
jgi:serine/threonine protein kinase